MAVWQSCCVPPKTEETMIIVFTFYKCLCSLFKCVCRMQVKLDKGGTSHQGLLPAAFRASLWHSSIELHKQAFDKCLQHGPVDSEMDFQAVACLPPNLCDVGCSEGVRECFG